jgi:hypothetical protein
MYYVSFEPFVRRWWPQLLIGWSRLFLGRLRDATVGTDVLVGVLAGTVYAVLFMLPSTVQNAPPILISSDTLASIPVLIGNSLMSVYWSIFGTLLCTFTLTLLRIVVRSRYLAACIVVAIITFRETLDSTQLSYWVLQFFAATVIVSVLVRYGVLAALTAVLVADLMQSPLTTDLGAFYFSNGLFNVSLVVALAFYGAYTATNTRLVWKRVLAA